MPCRIRINLQHNEGLCHSNYHVRKFVLLPSYSHSGEFCIWLCGHRVVFDKCDEPDSFSVRSTTAYWVQERFWSSFAFLLSILLFEYKMRVLYCQGWSWADGERCGKSTLKPVQTGLRAQILKIWVKPIENCNTQKGNSENIIRCPKHTYTCYYWDI